MDEIEEEGKVGA